MSGKRGQKSETSRQAPTQKTEAAVDRRQNNRMLKQCPSGIAQRLPHHAIAVPTAMQNRVTKTISVAPPLGDNWSKRSPALKPSSTSLLLISSGLTWGSSTTSLLLISPRPAKVSNFLLRVQLTSLLLISPFFSFFFSSVLISLLITGLWRPWAWQGPLEPQMLGPVRLKLNVLAATRYSCNWQVNTRGRSARSTLPLLELPFLVTFSLLRSKRRALIGWLVEFTRYVSSLAPNIFGDSKNGRPPPEQ